jgi:hypothetical protein
VDLMQREYVEEQSLEVHVSVNILKCNVQEMEDKVEVDL